MAESGFVFHDHVPRLLIVCFKQERQRQRVEDCFMSTGSLFFINMFFNRTPIEWLKKEMETTVQDNPMDILNWSWISFRAVLFDWKCEGLHSNFIIAAYTLLIILL